MIVATNEAFGVHFAPLCSTVSAGSKAQPKLGESIRSRGEYVCRTRQSGVHEGKVMAGLSHLSGKWPRRVWMVAVSVRDVLCHVLECPGWCP